MFSFLLLWLNLIFHHFQFNDPITEFVHNIKFDRFSVRCWGHNYIVCMQKKVFQAVLILGSECWYHQLMRWNHLNEDGLLSVQSVKLQMISCYRMQSNRMRNILCLFAFFSYGNRKILIFKNISKFDFIFNTWFDWISCLNGKMHFCQILCFPRNCFATWNFLFTQNHWKVSETHYVTNKTK